MLLRRIHVGRRYPLIYTLSIITVKNQSTEACGALYILNYETITKLSQDVTQYYKNTTSPICANARIQSDIQVWAVQKTPTSYRKKTRETRRGPRRIGLQTVSRWSMLALLWSATGRIHKLKLWDLDMKIQRSQSSPTSGDANAKWRAKISTRVSINLNYKHA